MNSIRRSLQRVAGFVLALVVTGAWAASSGTGEVTYLSGTLSVQRPDGTMRILSQKSAVQPGDLLTTQQDSYAQINFSDGSAATMRPNTTMRLEAYSYVEDQPQSDSLFMRLLKGALRTVTGAIGKRGDPEAYRIGTASATIGIRGSSGDTVECPSAGSCGSIEPGTYHRTYTGCYVMGNQGGRQIVCEGQLGYTRNQTALPVLLQSDPGLNLNQLPFALGIAGEPAIGGTGRECVVR